MSGPLLAAGAALLALVAVRDLAGATAVSRAARLSGGWRIPEVLTPLLPAETSLRLERAGLGSTLTPGAVLAGKLGCAGLGAFASPAFAGGAPERLAPLVLLAGPVGGFLLPDLLIARRARRRRAAMLAALPDALDLLGVGVASGRAPERVLAEIAAATAGPLSQELEITLAEIECGTGRPEAMAGLAHRVPGAEIAGLVASLERARGLAAGCGPSRSRRDVASRGARPPGGAGGSRGAEDSARRRPAPRAVGDADAPCCPDRAFGGPLSRRMTMKSAPAVIMRCDGG